MNGSSSRLFLMISLAIGASATALPVLAETNAAAATAPASIGFIENRGQLDSRVLYYAFGPRGAVYLTRGAIVLDLEEGSRHGRVAAIGLDVSGPRTSPDPLQTLERRGRAVWVRFEGADPAGALARGDRVPTRFNYIFGRDPARWTLDVPAYRRVVYRDLWPGLDLAISVEAGSVSCGILTAPGGDSARARFRYEGATPAELEAMGVFALHPQEQIRPDDSIRDNPSRLLWSTFLGGTSEEIAWAVSLDADRNPVVAGVTFSSHFPTTPGAYDTTYAGLGDVFVSKLDASGSHLLWSTFIGGTALNFDYGYAVVLDSQANPVVTGYTWSEDFPVTPDAYDRLFGGGVDAFVSKLDADGGHLLWSTFLGGVGYDIGYSIALDSEENPVVAGRTLSYDFPTTAGVFGPYASGEEDAFVSKLSASGEDLLWSTFVGGSAFDEASSLALDDKDDPIIVGHTASTDYPGGSFAGGLYDVIVTKLSPTASALLWSRTLGGGSYEFGNGLALDTSGDLFVCGATDSQDFPATPGAYDTSYNGNDDAFAAKLSGLTGDLLWATFLGGTEPAYETAFGIGVAPSGDVILAGSTPSPDFPVTTDAYDESYNGGLDDAFVARLDPSGSVLEWSTFLGGPGDDYAWSLALDSADAVVVGSAGPDFPSTHGVYDPSYNGDVADAFTAKLRTYEDPAAVPSSDLLPAALADLRVVPNLVTAGARLEFTLMGDSPVRLDLVDAAGRLRASLARSTFPAGRQSIYWNAGTAAGPPLPSGRYFVRISTPMGNRAVPLTLLR